MMAQIVQRDVLTLEPAIVAAETALTVIFPAVDLLRFNTKTFTLQNIGAVNLNAGQLQATPKPPQEATDNDYENVNTTAWATLAAGGVPISVVIQNDARRTWRIRASVASGSSQVK